MPSTFSKQIGRAQYSFYKIFQEEPTYVVMFDHKAKRRSVKLVHVAEQGWKPAAAEMMTLVSKHLPEIISVIEMNERVSFLSAREGVMA